MGVRTVDLGVAVQALPEGRVGQVVRPAGRSGDAPSPHAEPRDVAMAFHAQREWRGSVQKARVRTPVGLVTTEATLESDRRVRVQERAALVWMAAKAREIIPQRLRHHPRGVSPAPRGDRCTVGVVTVRAFHRPFVDAMLEGHVESSPDFLMARVAKLALLTGEQSAVFVSAVNGMAACATNLARQVCGSVDVHLAEVAGVALQAASLPFDRRQGRKANDLLLVQVQDVQERRPVAPFATSPFRRLVLHRDGSVVRIARERLPDRRMTSLADRAAHELLLLWRTPGILGEHRALQQEAGQRQGQSRRSKRQCNSELPRSHTAEQFDFQRPQPAPPSYGSLTPCHTR